MDSKKLTKLLLARTEELQADYNLIQYKKILNPDVSSSIDRVSEMGHINGKLKMISEILDLILEETRKN
jgi:hypothetical protein